MEVQSQGEQQTKKAENLVFEYNCLLSSLLETQREYYNTRLKQLDVAMDTSLLDMLESIKFENNGLREKIKHQEGLEKDLDHLSEIIKRESEITDELTRENQELVKVERQRSVFYYNKSVQDEISDLESRIKDLQFYVKAQKRLENEKVDHIEIRKKL